MTPEEIEYIREWAASGNENRLCGHIPSVVLYRFCRPISVGQGWWKLSESGLTIASQAERIRELEEEVQAAKARHSDLANDVLELEEEELRERKAAFEQACEVAESAQWCLMQDVSGSVEPLKTMRANRERLLKGSADSVAPSIWLGPVVAIDNSRTWTRTSPSSSSLSTKIEQLEAEVQSAKARHSDLANDVLKPALTRILELEEELREWRCNTVPGRCRGCPDCQPIGGTRESTKLEKGC